MIDDRLWICTLSKSFKITEVSPRKVFSKSGIYMLLGLRTNNYFRKRIADLLDMAMRTISITIGHL